jgi:hypothetical protein
MIERKSVLLARSEWCHALRELTLCCAGDDACDTPDRLRELNRLMFSAPAAALLDALKPLSPRRLKALIELSAYESAVMAMIGPGTGCLVSRNGDGASLATVALSCSWTEKSGSGVTPALALIGALALSMSSVEVAARSRSLQALVDLQPALH